MFIAIHRIHVCYCVLAADQTRVYHRIGRGRYFSYGGTGLARPCVGCHGSHDRLVKQRGGRPSHGYDPLA